MAVRAVHIQEVIMRYEGHPREGFPQGVRQAGQELVATAVREIDGTNKRNGYQNDNGGQKNENDHGRVLRT